MKPLLFIINGLGLGNSTRCDSLIKPLIAKGYQIDILTSGNGIGYFKDHQDITNLFRSYPLYYGSNKGKLSAFQTIFSLPDLLKIFKKNVELLKNILGSKEYWGLIIDSDYTAALIKKWLSVPLIALNNADVVVHKCRQATKIPNEIKLQYFLEKCDNWFHRVVPNIVLSPVIQDDLDNTKRLRHFPPLVRGGLCVRKPGYRLERILVMLSGSQFGTCTDFLNLLPPLERIKIDVVGREGESDGRITYHGKLFDNKELINRADMMVVNGGFSAVSEAIVLRKPAVIIPVENHAEQFVNASVVEGIQLGLKATSEDAAPKMLEMIAEFPKFVDAHERFGCRSDGSSEAAQIIDELVKGYAT